jgi:aryl-alcohol dehydrogenase-like predicted oxidoreductase
MEYRTLGGTGLNVSTHCLGTMMFGEWGNTDVDDCIGTIRAAIDGGINFVDTADVYSAGESEEIVGKALKGRRDEVILATKVHGQMGPGHNDAGNSRVWIAKEVENSLRRLGTDHIDLYQIHRPDGDTDVEETLGALTDLQRQGKIRYFGSSTYPGWQMVEAQWTAERRGLSRFRTEQPPYSIFVRQIEHDVLPVAERYGMGVLVWSPLCRGWLTGRYRREGWDDSPDSRATRGPQRADWLGALYDQSRPEVQRKLDLVEQLLTIADKAGITLTHMAIAFTLAHPAVTSTIIGPRTREQLDDLIGAADVRLDAGTLDAIDELVAPGTIVDEEDRGFDPWWFEPESRRRRS